MKNEQNTDVRPRDRQTRTQQHRRKTNGRELRWEIQRPEIQRWEIQRREIQRRKNRCRAARHPGKQTRYWNKRIENDMPGYSHRQTHSFATAQMISQTIGRPGEQPSSNAMEHKPDQKTLNRGTARFTQFIQTFKQPRPNMLGFHTEPKFTFHNTQRQQP